MKRTRAGAMKQTTIRRYSQLKSYKPLARGEPMMRTGNKYNAKRTHSVLWNRIFDSMGEARYADHLFAREQNGEIEDVVFQKRVDLEINGVSLGIGWKVDFRYFEHRFGGKHTEQMVWDEFKGFATADFKLKLKLWQAGAGPGMLRVTYARRNKVEPYRFMEYFPARSEPQYCTECDWQLVEGPQGLRWCRRCGSLEQKQDGLWEIRRPTHEEEKDNGKD